MVLFSDKAVLEVLFEALAVLFGDVREGEEEDERWRGSNHAAGELDRGKKQWSAQWQEERKRIARRMEQYMQGRLRV